jgi:hypothetical protein
MSRALHELLDIEKLKSHSRTHQQTANFHSVLPFPTRRAEFNLKIELVDAGNAIALKAHNSVVGEKTNYYLPLLSPPAASGTFFMVKIQRHNK